MQIDETRQQIVEKLRLISYIMSMEYLGIMNKQINHLSLEQKGR